MEHSDPLYRRTRRSMAVVLLVYAVLVGTHLGEFWPFSIYPMFSRGGHSWVRSVVRAVPPQDPLQNETGAWSPVTFDDLPGDPYPLGPTGINQNDLSNFLSKSAQWTPEILGALRGLFPDDLEGRSLLVFRVDGRLMDGREVAVEYTPFVWIRSDTTIVTPTVEVGS